MPYSLIFSRTRSLTAVSNGKIIYRQYEVKCGGSKVSCRSINSGMISETRKTRT